MKTQPTHFGENLALEFLNFDINPHKCILTKAPNNHVLKNKLHIPYPNVTIPAPAPVRNVQEARALLLGLPCQRFP